MKSPRLILSRLCTKVHEIFRRCRRGDPSYFPEVWNVLSVKVVENRTNLQDFWPLYLGRTTKTFIQQIDNAIYFHCLAKFGGFPFADLSLRSLAMQNLWRVGKNYCPTI